MNYRLYQPADFAQLYAIEEACFAPPVRFPRAYMRHLVNSSRAAAWVAEHDNRLAGFAIVEWFRDAMGAIAYLETIELAADWRRQGIAAQLLRHAEVSARAAGAQAIWLHVDAENAPAIRLYLKHGYRHEGREEHYYANRRPALIYSKSLLMTAP